MTINFSRQFILASVVLVALLAVATLTESLKAANGIQVASVPINHQPVSLQSTQTFSNVEFVAQIGGPIGPGAVQGNYAYVGVGTHVLILNISDPSQPTVVGQTGMMPDLVSHVTVSGTHAYVADGNNGIYIFDVSDPAHPSQTGVFTATGYATSVAVAGNYAYIVYDYGGINVGALRVVNISDLAHPAEVGFVTTPGNANDVAVAEGFAYVAEDRVWDGKKTSGGGLRVISVITPTFPTLVGFYDSPGWPTGVVVEGAYAYLSDGTDGLRIVNISDPTHPAETGAWVTPGSARDVAINGNDAYIADGSTGLRIINITNKTGPYETGFYKTPGFASDVAVAGSSIFVSDAESLLIFNVYHPTVLVGSYSAAPGQAIAVDVAGSYAYIADGEDGLRIINVSDPAHPNETGSFKTPGRAVDARVKGNTAYIAEGDKGLYIANISDPANPQLEGFWDTPGAGSGVEVTGQLALIADGYSGLRIINVANPANPTEVGSYDTPGFADGVAAKGQLAYIADGTYLRVVDIANPANPQEIGSVRVSGFATKVVITGCFAYVADSYGGLSVVDISDPLLPVEIGLYDTTGSTGGVAIGGSGRVFLADGARGLRVMSVSDPTHPAEIGFYDTSQATGVAAVGNYAYVADGLGGLIILHCSVCESPVAAFDASPRSGLAPLKVAYTDQSSGGVTDWLWQFGDRVTSTLASPTHTYTVTGTFTVVLKVSGPGGSDTLTRANFIAVKGVIAAFSANPAYGTPPLTVTFTNQSAGNYTSSLWDLGDGITSTLNSPTHTYTTLGAYTVTLTVNGPEGSDTLFKPAFIAVLEPKLYLPVAMKGYALPETGP